MSSGDKKTKLFRIRKTVSKMLNARGYLVSQKELDRDKDSFVEDFGRDPAPASARRRDLPCDHSEPIHYGYYRRRSPACCRRPGARARSLVASLCIHSLAPQLTYALAHRALTHCPDPTTPPRPRRHVFHRDSSRWRELS